MAFSGVATASRVAHRTRRRIYTRRLSGLRGSLAGWRAYEFNRPLASASAGKTRSFLSTRQSPRAWNEPTIAPRPHWRGNESPRRSDLPSTAIFLSPRRDADAVGGLQPAALVDLFNQKRKGEPVRTSPGRKGTVDLELRP